MPDLLAELAIALRERLEIIADQSSRQDVPRHTERLQEVSERIEALEGQLPVSADPQLRHFLRRRSYSKALDLIQGKATS